MALLRQFLSTEGDGSGTVSGASDFSSVAGELFIQPASKQEHRIEQLIVFIEDNAALLGDTFGSAALTNGIRIRVLDDEDAATLDITGGLAVKRIADFLSLGARVTGDSSGTNKYAAYILDFPQPVVLNGNTPTRLAVTLNDDLSNLVLLKFMALGIKRGMLVA